MDFAADAVAEMMGPPPAAATRAPKSDPGEPSFADHLEAVVDDDDAPPTAERSAPAQSEQGKAAESEVKQDSPAKGAEETQLVEGETASGEPAPDTTPAALLVQLIAPAPQPQAAATPNAGAKANSEAAPPVAPTNQAAPNAAPAQAPTDAVAAAGDAQGQTGGEAKSDTPTHKNNGAAAANAPAPTDGANAPTVNAGTPTSEQANAAAAPTQSAPAAASPAASSAATTDSASSELAAIGANAPQHQQTPDASAAKRIETTTRAEPPINHGEEAPPSPAATIAAGAAQKPAAGAHSAPASKDVAAPQPATTPVADMSAPAPTGDAASVQTTSHTQHAAPEQSAARAAPAANQVAQEIVRRFNGGATQFEMRLDPPELGRVDVKLEVSRDHRVTAIIAADSPQAVTELARHARELEQMLQSAGLELSDNGLSFDLRQGQEGAAEAQDGRSARPGGDASDALPQQQTSVARPLGYERWRGVRVDMMV